MLPVRGSVEISGNVAPLFDLMLGMNPDSTGIENIRLRGLYLDLSPAEIEARIEDITEFSKLGKFATLTSTRPDIVVMDEIIGVGDAAFIKSAQQRLDSFMAEVGIVVVASHSLEVLKTMCNRGAVLHHGAMHFIGPIDDAIESYAELSRSL
jgi:ABC-2 type transport system ATP-binding protein